MSNSISIPIRVCVKDLEITMEMLKNAFDITTNNNDKATQFLAIVCDELNRLSPIDKKPMYRHYNLNTEERLAHFFAQCYHEAGSKVKKGEALGENLSYQADVVYEKVENFVDGAKTFDNYKRAFEVGRLFDNKLVNQHNIALDGVRKKYGEASEKYKEITLIIEVRKRKKNDETSEKIQELLGIQPNDWRKFENLPKANQTDQEGIGNLIYLDANRKNPLGNKGSQDGYNFRGRGMIQLTGKDNYTKFQNFYKEHNSQEKDFLNNPNYRDAIATNPKLAFLSAVWFWNENKLHKKAMPNNVEAITTIVNGGFNGLLDRAIAYYRIKNPHFTQEDLMEEAKKIKKRAGEKELAFVRRQIAKIKEIVQGQAQEGIFKDFRE